MADFDAALLTHYNKNKYSISFEEYRSSIVKKLQKKKKNAKVPRIAVAKTTIVKGDTTTMVFENTPVLALQIIGSILNHEKYCSKRHSEWL